ncbi:hypothetical protein WJX84_000651 [Apatococcus fuscideae]|uniref:Uncharacterized protein n=1 Tax=Apatococcus fuscideae TaxID=2026836 RepID=A0AAW1TH02_9CHLO
MTVHLAVPPAAIFCSGRLQEKSRGLLTRSFRNAQRPRVSALRHGSPVCRHQASAADRQACASKLLRVLCGQPLPDHREAANLTASVRLLDVHLAADCLLAWSAFDSQLSSCKAAASLHSFLSRKVLAIPSDIEHSQFYHCTLTLRPWGYHFCRQALNRLMTSLFEAIPEATRSAGLPQILLDRFDLFHAHIFVSADAGVGLLFHASEYPAQGDAFRFNLGYCQTDSSLQYSEAKMSWRNMLFIKGHLFAIDLTEGSYLYTRLLIPELSPFRTAQDHDFGNIPASSASGTNARKRGVPA